MTDHVFKKVGDTLRLVGDWDGLYRDEADPWCQSGEGDLSYKEYYQTSRARLIDKVHNLKFNHLPVELRNPSSEEKVWGLEVGCGHGHVTEKLLVHVGDIWHGMDVSKEAIARAGKNYSTIPFCVGDISQKTAMASGTYSFVVWGQLWWYVMTSARAALYETARLTRPGGFLVISQAFLWENQRYGNYIAEGFDGAVQLLLREGYSWWELAHADLLSDPFLKFKDGLIILRRIEKE